jgi:hypothetical protein
MKHQYSKKTKNKVTPPQQVPHPLVIQRILAFSAALNHEANSEKE